MSDESERDDNLPAIERRYTEAEWYEMINQWENEQETFSRKDIIDMSTNYGMPISDAERIVDQYSQDEKELTEKDNYEDIGEKVLTNIPNSLATVIFSPFRIATTVRQMYTDFRGKDSKRGLSALASIVSTAGIVACAGIFESSIVYSTMPQNLKYALPILVITNAVDAIYELVRYADKGIQKMYSDKK